MKFVPASLSRKVARQALVAKKNSPNLLFATGLVGSVATVVVACRATLKLEEVVEDTQSKLLQVEQLRSERYSEKDRKSDTQIVKVQGVVKIAKLYAPAVGLGVLSIACLTQSHRTLTQRNVALTAAYSGLAQAFSEYRQHVSDELGPEKEAEFYHGVTVEHGKDENGKKTVVKKAGERAPYSRMFAEGNPRWQDTPEYNGFFLKSQQEYANLRLRANGHLFLNDVLTALGFPETSAGAVTGWLYEKGTGDSYVDFGIGDWPEAKDFVHGKEGAILLNFNVDGIIYDKI